MIPVTVTWVLMYATVFGLGPLIVLWLMRPPASVGAVRRLGLALTLLVVMAIGMSILGAPEVFSAAGLWAAWVVSMAVMGHALRLILGGTGQATRRWTAAVAAIGATIPWFGILMARMMAG